MKKFLVVFAIFAALIFVVSGCGSSKNDDQTNTGDANPTTEGIYLGIIGFNESQTIKDIALLDKSTVNNYESFIDYLTSGDGTGLYFADYTALKKMRNYPIPPKLKNVALVTFTDGLDNISLNDEYNPENYGSTDAYQEAIHKKIVSEKIHEHSVEAYTIGLKGKDVTDDAKFEKTLKGLASSDSNVFQVSDMNEVKESFAAIAKALYSVSKTEKLDIKVPGGYDDGQLLRFTFDNPDTATDSELYIEATFRRSNGRTLAEITYKGFAKGQKTISSDDKDGAYYHFVFENLKYTNGDPLSDSDIRKIMLWKQTSSGGWDKESEFGRENSVDITEDKNSALIMLVLDCTTSLGSDFPRMQQAAKEFISTLVNGNNSNSNGSNSNENNGGGTADNEESDNPDSGESNNITEEECMAASGTWNDAANSCSRTDNCTGLPENADWNIVSSINQTYNGSSWVPSTTGSYSETASTSKCYFQCNSGYTWNGTQCVEPTFPKCDKETVSFPCKDSLTGYIWSDASDIGTDNGMTWQEAKDHCDSLNTTNYGWFSTGWHLPNINELRTLIHRCSGTVTGGYCTIKDPDYLSYSDQPSYAFNEMCYCSTSVYDEDDKYSTFSEDEWNFFWSSSIVSDDMNEAWNIYFGHAMISTDDKTDYGRVRCVRDPMLDTGKRVQECTALPANAQWNAVSEITQTWNGSSWIPSTTGSYSEESSTSECRFKCLNGSEWNGSDCVVDTDNIPECSSKNATPCKDSSTGYIWSTRVSSSTYSNYSITKWNSAVSYCDNLTEGGYSDWHLPNISELRTLVQNCGSSVTGGSCGVVDTGDPSTSCLEYDCFFSGCGYCSPDSTGKYSKFGETGWFFSSSTFLNGNDVYAFGIYFGYAEIDYIDLNHYSYIRCVRNAE